MLDPSYIMKHTHVNPDVTLLRSTKPYSPKTDGSDYPTYLTGTVQGTIAAENISNEIAAAGIFVNVIIVYPKGPGIDDVVYAYSGDQV